jgi:hypothetical protein
MYDIVISFAGEDRETAKALADALTLKGLTVFYDEYAKADLWGKDLYSHLTHVYRDEAKYCVMIISEAYAQKQWTNHERRAAQARAIRENREYILPLRLDDASVEGVLQTTSYMDYRATPLEEVVDLLVEKVTSYNRERGIAFEVVRLEEVFLKAGLGPKGKLPFGMLTSPQPVQHVRRNRQLLKPQLVWMVLTRCTHVRTTASRSSLSAGRA